MKLRSIKQCMQDTKLSSLYTTVNNKIWMHMINNKILKSIEFKDQNKEIIKNNLKINEDTCMNSKNARRTKTCNWHQT